MKLFISNHVGREMTLKQVQPGVIAGTVAVAIGMILVWSQSYGAKSASARPSMHHRVPSCTTHTCSTDDYQPVETSMHEFMEYMFEPGFKRLKASMANDEPDRQAWKAIKGDSLVLAEASNLLLMRIPEEDSDAWRENAEYVRAHGKALYEAAKAQERGKAVESYRAMIDNCNRCHDSHADGEYQLEY